MQLRPYQQKIHNNTKDMRHCALFLPTGLGKTVLTLCTGKHLYDKQAIDRILVVSRGKVAENWHYEEIPKFLANQVDTLSLVWNSQKPYTMGENNVVWQKNKPIHTAGKLLVMCMNKEAMLTKKGQIFLDEFFKGKVLFVIDESTIIKNPTAKITRTATKYGKLAVARRILSGTPSPNGVEDLFAQYRFLDENILGTRSVVAFRRAFCEMEEMYFGGKRVLKVTGAKNQADLEKLVAPFTIRMKKEDALPDLPPKNYITRRFQLSKEQRKVYDTLKEQYRAELLEEHAIQGRVTATLVIQRITRLHQIVSGYTVTDENPDEAYALPKSAKMEALVDYLHERGREKTIIWARYRFDIESIHKRLQEEFGEGCSAPLYGGISKDERHENLQSFMRGTTSYLIANPQVASHGLTLTMADTAVYYSNSYNWEDRAQSEDRIHRIGQNKVTTYVDLVAEDTIDDRILEVLKNKEAFSDGLWQAGYQQWFL